MSLPRVSVVIATLDRAECLKQALAGLAQLAYPSFEVIVVQGPSRDGTQAVVDAFSGRLKSVACPAANLSMARNLGIAQCAGDIIVLMDDDAVPPPFWLDELVRGFSDDAIGGVGGYVIGRSGVEYQARKIICDPFGRSHFVADWFDERALSPESGSLYPAPMGVNVAFRRQALADIGGFDEAFSYYLDETDVCRRLFLAGRRIVFAPEAVVWHQFAGSRLRDHQSVPREMHTIARSKAYFMARHGADQPGAETELERFAQEKIGLIQRLVREGLLHHDDEKRLIAQVRDGIAEGGALSPSQQRPLTPAPPSAFCTFRRGEPSPLTLALVCRRYPPRNEGGIARWTQLTAEGLALRGLRVHVICEAQDKPGIHFADGIWYHELAPLQHGYDVLMDRYEMNASAAGWAMAVRLHLGVLASFGVDVMSSPIWDCEGMACCDDAPIAQVVSLHTTSVLARHDFNPMAAPSPHHGMAKAEAHLLQAAAGVLANSKAALQDIEQSSGVPLAAKAHVIAHGTPLEQPGAHRTGGSGLRCLFVGRAEARKGFDLALKGLDKAVERGIPVSATFAGGDFEHALVDKLRLAGALTTLGVVDRERLMSLYREHDIVLMPSRYESFGLVAIEAMACATPVIATRVGGLAEIIEDGTDGLLVAPGDDAPDAIAEALAELCRQPERLAALSEAAWHTANRRFSIETMCDGLEVAFRHFAKAKHVTG